MADAIKRRPLTEAGVKTEARRRGIGRALGEVHYRLRTEGDTRGRKAMAVALGTLIGCIPLYGTHAALCALLAGVLGLNRLVTYLAAHINNPITAPLLLAISFKLGHRAQYGVWPSLAPRALAEVGLWNIGGDLLLGGLLLGVILAPLAGIAAWIVGGHAPRPERWSRIIDEAARPYLESGVRHWEFVRGKLRYDPVYLMLHERFEGAGARTVLDLGCGRGIALSLLDAARGAHAARTTHETSRVDGAVAVAPGELRGVDRNVAAVRVAQAALGDRATIEVADLASYQPPDADIVLLLDVLHYLDAEAQERLLARACRALRTGGVLLVREPDASRGVRFLATRSSERCMAILRGHLRQRFHYRTEALWLAMLRGHGLDVKRTDASRGTPFANVLLEGRAP